MFKSRYAFHSLKLLWPQVWTKVPISSYTLIRNKRIYIKVLEKKKDRFLDWSSFLALLIVCNMLWYILIEHWRLAPHPTSCQTQFPKGSPSVLGPWTHAEESEQHIWLNFAAAATIQNTKWKPKTEQPKCWKWMHVQNCRVGTWHLP